MYAVILLIAFQFVEPSSAADRQRAGDLRRMEELRDESQFRLAKEKDIKYRAAVLAEAHRNFVVKWNIYADKYQKGLSATKELSEVVKAWKSLEKTDGFDYVKDKK